MVCCSLFERLFRGVGEAENKKGAVKAPFSRNDERLVRGA